MRNEPVMLEDGETIVVIAKTSGPTVSDPADEYPYLSQAYRVVADRVGRTLALVPLLATPTRESQTSINEMKQRKSAEDLKEILELMVDPQFITDFVEKQSGWKFSGPIIVEKKFDPTGTIPGPTSPTLSTAETNTKTKPVVDRSKVDWDRDTGNGFNERGYSAGNGTYHDPMG